jgi:hypothetical protein
MIPRMRTPVRAPGYRMDASGVRNDTREESVAGVIERPLRVGVLCFPDDDPGPNRYGRNSMPLRPRTRHSHKHRCPCRRVSPQVVRRLRPNSVSRAEPDRSPSLVIAKATLIRA